MAKRNAGAGIDAALLALPQVIYLRTGHVRKAGYSLFHWGYTLDNPTVLNVLKYLSFTFGFKLLLIAFALYLGTRFQRRIRAAVSSLVLVAFSFQFSEEVLANHKFLNIWLVVVNLFVAYGLWRLWHSRLLGNTAISRVATSLLLALIVLGGVIDLFPLHNSYFVEIPFKGDPLVRWVNEQTDPRAVFLTDRFVTHRLMIAGRRVFHGWPYFTWGAGHLATERDDVYKKLFEDRDAGEVLQLLHENNISYVAIDNGVRQGGFIKNINEAAVYEANFEKVFEDKDNNYDQLSIYKVPAGNVSLRTKTAVPADIVNDAKKGNDEALITNALAGGRGNGHGQFEHPLGLAVDKDLNLYVADTGNSRIQKFSPQGDFVTSFGKAGTGDGELREPNGIALDNQGNIYVTDAANNRVLKFKSDGTLLQQWTGPDPGFYGPRDIAIGPDKSLFVLDQGRVRVVRLDQDGKTISQWGRTGAAAGEFNGPTGLAIAGDRVYIADAGNNRIQIFDLSGNFVGQWAVPKWDKYLWHFPDLAIDVQAGRVYVTSGWTREVLVLNMNGDYLGSMKPQGQQEFNSASSIVFADAKSGKHLYVLNTGSYVVEAGAPSISSFELESRKNN